LLLIAALLALKMLTVSVDAEWAKTTGTALMLVLPAWMF
jgi:hypothetical protein